MALLPESYVIQISNRIFGIVFCRSHSCSHKMAISEKEHSIRAFSGLNSTETRTQNISNIERKSDIERKSEQLNKLSNPMSLMGCSLLKLGNSA